MKKVISSLLLLLAVTMATTSCKKSEPIVNPTAVIEVQGKSADGLSVAQDATIIFSAKVEQSSDYTVVWSVNGFDESTDKEFKFVAKNVGEQIITLKVYAKDGGQSVVQSKISVHGKYKYGSFILNEGNMTSEQGTVIFVSPEGQVTDSAYWHVNGTFLGNVTQDLYIANDKIYFISQNGGGDGMLVVANAATLKKEAGYSKQQMAPLSWPTHIAVVGDNAYIRDGKGVYNFSLSKKEVKYIDGSKGASKNRMAVADGKVFVPAGKNIFVIKDGQIIHTIEMPGTISGLIKSSDNNILVSCTTTPAQITKIKATDYSVIQKNELAADFSLSAGWGASPGISAKADTIYFNSASTKISRHIFSQNKTEYLTDVKDYITDAGIVYSNLGVNPKTGEVWFNTIKGYGMDYLINDIAVFNFSSSTPMMKANYKNRTHFPAGVFFTYDYQ